MKAAVYLSTLGCRLNEAELVSWTGALEDQGHTVVSRVQDANLIVLNTCAVTSEASRKSRKLAGSLHRKNPNARLVVTGCMAELEPERAAALAGVDMVVSNMAKDALVAEVLNKLDLEAMPQMATEPESAHPYSDPPDASEAQSALLQLGKRSTPRSRAFIKVQDGCRNHCSYCVVTIARGDERSSSIANLIDEINGLHEESYKEAVLTGVHLGGYGHDLDTDLFTLVRALLRDTDIERLRLSSLEPWDLPKNFSELWDNPRLMPHLHLPLQSGSDTVLRRMSRRCFTDEYRDLVTNLRANVRDLNITTDLIVGFPGETDDEFTESLAFVEEIGFGHMHIFGFSPREGTRAEKLIGRIDGKTIRERSRAMHRVAARMKEQHMAGYLGTSQPVLWESGRALEDGRTAFQGYTDNYLRVRTVGIELGNRVTMAKLLEIEGTPAERFVAEV
ncbi:MAG: tRNA (N(6)-L-threonylcarbamoyladenosine(37)-C(2))-methylthiotransferase MtaB [Myxococcales bacterium]|nr:tRNA (N(6)-L-threonylcarbamoyladenosine(37)-C(2))-methylthiotransferase MtaB [Myxococcales bacterium]